MKTLLAGMLLVFRRRTVFATAAIVCLVAVAAWAGPIVAMVLSAVALISFVLARRRGMRSMSVAGLVNGVACVFFLLTMTGYRLSPMTRERLNWAAVIAAVLGLCLSLVRAATGGRRGRASGSIHSNGDIWPAAAFALVSLAVLPVSHSARIVNSKASCLVHVKQVTLALRQIVRGNGNRHLPTAWCDTLTSLDGFDKQHTFLCPERSDLSCGYALNSALTDSWPSGQISVSHVVMLFESDAGWNAAGGPELLPDEPRHLGGDNYGFADGHVQWIRRKKLPDGTWVKEPDADWVIWKPELKKNAETQGQ